MATIIRTISERAIAERSADDIKDFSLQLVRPALQEALSMSEVPQTPGASCSLQALKDRDG